MASSDYILQEVKGIKKSFDNASKFTLEKFMQLPAFTVVETTEWSEIFTSTEGLGGAQELAEQETPPTNALQDGYSVTIVTKRWGNSITVTETDMEKFEDSTVKVRKFLERQRKSVLRSLVKLFITQLHLFLNEAFDSTSDFLAPDGVELCGAHSWNTSGATAWDNSATAALDTTAMDVADEYAGAFLDGNDEEMPLTWDTIVVKKGSANARQARRLFAEGIKPVQINDINLYFGELTIVETPYITSTNKKYWFLFDTMIEESPLYAGIKKFPRMKAPIIQNDESIRSNVTGFWKQGIANEPFNVYGATGAT